MLLVLAMVGACGGSGDGGGGPAVPNANDPTATFTVGGAVAGLTGTGLVLKSNGGDTLAISVNGAFTFATALANGASFNVTVQIQPSSRSQTCIVTGGAGLVAGANVTSVNVACFTSTARFAYVADFTSNNVSAYRIDATSGALTPVTGTFLTGINPNAIAIDRTGQFVYVTNNGGGISAYRINATSGALTAVTDSPFVSGINPNAITTVNVP
ncbi:MAG: beta-propeller fold lactonase family protein [Betaproteobacteria bacterium]